MRQTQFTFLDENGESVLIWRPTKPPPCATVTPVPPKLPVTVVDQRAETQLPAPVPLMRDMPPGQVLPRGVNGIDGVLQRAREAQRLHWSLQERRVRQEKQAAQRRLNKDLDDQREFNRMLRLAEYQEELVNVFGPTVRNIISDTFFDDGTDPALAALAAQRARPATRAPPLHTAGPKREHTRQDVLDAWRAAREEHQDAAGLDATVVDRELRALSLPSHAHTVLDTVPPQTRQKEMLNKALDHNREGRRMPY